MRRWSTHKIYKLNTGDPSQACFGIPEAKNAFGLKPRNSKPSMPRLVGVKALSSIGSYQPVRAAMDDKEQVQCQGQEAPLPTEVSERADPPRRHSCPDPPSAHEGLSRTVLRQKHRPRHRSASMNNTVAGILRPSRYSDDNLCQQRRQSSLPSMASTSISNGSFSTRSSFSDDVSSRSDAVWVPLGVRFEPSMEVYVFEK